MAPYCSIALCANLNSPREGWITMTGHSMKFLLAALLSASVACMAQAPASAPDGATGQCKDGTYTTSAKKSGACRGHKGVKTWFATVGGSTDPDIKGARPSQSTSAKQAAKSDETVNPHDNSNVSSARADAINKKSGNAAVATPNDSGKTLPGPAANGSTAANSSANGSSSRNSAKGSSSASVAGRTAAPGGGPGLVWLNNKSNVYHCYGSEWYGKTKNGKYVSEKDAMNAGAKPEHGKSCATQ
jgi:hypothetical protein